MAISRSTPAAPTCSTRSFNKRYQRASTVVTTNLAFKDWGKLFHNVAAASAIADRLVQKGLLVKITRKSKRSDTEVESA